MASVSVVIPAYNRVELLLATLSNVQKTLESTHHEIIVVDDGSAIELESTVPSHLKSNSSFIRTSNQGLIAAKNTGLTAASMEFCLFLDSDDLLAQDKFEKQLKRHVQEQSDVSYCNFAFFSEKIEQHTQVADLPETHDPMFLFARLRPPPHVPIYRTSYLKEHLLANPSVSPSRDFDVLGEVWMYMNLLMKPAKISFINECLSFVRNHPEERLSTNWERQSIAALQLTQAWLQKHSAVNSSHHKRALQFMAANAFNTWRKLPQGCPHNLEHRWLTLTKSLPPPNKKHLGGKRFQVLATCIGIINAGKLAKFFNPKRYTYRR